MPCAATPADSLTLQAPQALAARRPRPLRGGNAWSRIAHALGWRAAAPVSATGLHAARDAFAACLSDMPVVDARALHPLLGHARTLAELWHLRPELYRRLALHHSQAEAERRLATLNRWFAPQRPPR